MFVRQLAKVTEVLQQGVRRMIRNIRLSTALALTIVAFALTPALARAQSYTGHREHVAVQ